MKLTGNKFNVEFHLMERKITFGGLCGSVKKRKKERIGWS
jgi:hypothetical protein